MILLNKLLQNSNNYKHLPRTKKEFVVKIFKSLLSEQYYSDFAGGFYPNYLGTIFSLSESDTILIGNIGQQSKIFQLKYEIENPLTGESIVLIDSHEVSLSLIQQIESELVDEDGNPIEAKITEADIFPFYSFANGVEL